METLRQKLTRGDVTIVFGMGRLMHYNLIQAIGMNGGFDAVWFDLEHVGNSIEQLEIGAMAARSQGMDSFVRLAPTDYSVISRSLECGASGVMAAQVRTAAEAEQVVRWSKYAPRGVRGLNVSSYDGRFGLAPLSEHVERANKETLVIIQIETLESLDHLDGIASIPEVDMLFIGPSDLSQALGVTGDFWNPKCLEALDKVAAACAKHGTHWGCLPPDPKYAARAVEHGCKLLSITSDLRLLNLGIKAVKDNYKDFLKGVS